MEKENVVGTKANNSIAIFVVLFIAVLIFAIVTVTVVIIKNSKPSKEQAREIIAKYVTAMNDVSGNEMIETVDVEGTIILKESGEEGFDENYKNKTNYINEYLTNRGYGDIDSLKEYVANTFEGSYGYYNYELEDIVSIEKSEKSKKIIVVKANVKMKSTFYNSSNVAKISLLKVNGEYKIVGFEL